MFTLDAEESTCDAISAISSKVSLQHNLLNKSHAESARALGKETIHLKAFREITHYACSDSKLLIPQETSVFALVLKITATE